MSYYNYFYACKNPNDENIMINVSFRNETLGGSFGWHLEDINYVPQGCKSHKSFKEKLSRQFRYMGLSYSEVCDLITQGLYEFAGQENVEKAFNAAWLEIQPNIAEVLNGNKNKEEQ